MHILFIGYGKTSQRVAKQLFELDHQITTISLTTKTDRYANHLIQDVHQLDLSQLSPIDCAYVLLAPKQGDVESYRNTYLDSTKSIIPQLKKHDLKRLILVSSTRVYGENSGEMIDDDTSIQPSDEQGEILREMELSYLEALPNITSIIRPSGIYNGKSGRMISLAEKTKAYPNIHWSNRIYLDDLVDFLVYMLHVEHFEQSYIVSDNVPEPLHEKILRIQKEMNLPELILESENQTGKKILAKRMMESGFLISNRGL